MKAKAMKYSIKACNGVKIDASPVIICKIPHINPEIKLALNPQRKATIKIGTIVKEIEIDGIGDMFGNKSSNIAKPAKIATSNIACKGNLLRIKKPPMIFGRIHRGSSMVI